jgi:hypothetical protein
MKNNPGHHGSLRVMAAFAGLLFTVAHAQAQCLFEHLFLEDASDTALFGSSISMDSEILVVGAMLDTGAAWGSGRLHLHRRNGSSWQRTQILEAPDGDLTDMLGSAVDIDGSTIIAGAWWDEENGERSGSAYIFEDDGSGNFVFAGKLTASDGLPEATFGRTVAVDGNLAVVGAPLHSSDASAAGAAYLYERDESGWSQVAKITPDALSAGDRFGISVDLEASTLVIGSSWADEERGRVHVFEIGAGGAVTQVAMIQPPAIDPGDQFGFDLALDQDTLLVGAYLDDEEATDGGSLWFYERTALGWSLAQGPVLAGLGEANAQLGVSVALQDFHALAGARYASANGSPANSGLAVIFNDFGSWQHTGVIGSNTPQTDSEFGWDVALDAEQALYGAVSALYEDVLIEDDGSAYIIDFNDEFCGGNTIGDINSDGRVDGADLTILLGEWGVCPQFYCAGDLNGDGLIDGIDLTILLGSWS